ncbi:hypothetical protein HGG75_22205 [Ochrobactrum pseudogrignonense]|nr:hypothetical protein [Brucella pseudogrignonensis]
MSHSVNVTQSGRNTLAVVNSTMQEFCSDENLTELRLLAYKAHYLRDIGRVLNNRIVCTALWGRLSPPADLPKWDREVDGGHRLWANAEKIGKHQTKVEMIMHGSAIVLHRPLLLPCTNVRNLTSARRSLAATANIFTERLAIRER